MKPGIQEKPVSSLPRVPWLGGGIAAVARGSSPRGSRGLPWDVAPGSEVTPQGTRRTFGLQRTSPLPRLSGEGVRTGGAPAGGASGLSGHDGLRRVAAFISESMRTLGEPAAAPPVPLRGGPALFSPASPCLPVPSRPFSGTPRARVPAAAARQHEVRLEAPNLGRVFSHACCSQSTHRTALGRSLRAGSGVPAALGAK